MARESPRFHFPHLDRLCVCGQAFGARELSDYVREPTHARTRHFLLADALHKIRNGQAAARPCAAAGGQLMVGSDCIITERLCAPVTKENTPRAFDSIGKADGPLRRAGSNVPGQTDSDKSRRSRDDFCARPAPRHFLQASAARGLFWADQPAAARFRQRRPSQDAPKWSRSTEIASGSCSACAIKSAAIHRALPRTAKTSASVGPASRSIAQSLLTNVFSRR